MHSKTKKSPAQLGRAKKFRASYRTTNERNPQPAADRALYLYAISQMPKRTAEPIVAEGIDGQEKVEALRCENYVCWISRVSKEEFADRLTDNMQDLEWLAAAGLRHQRAVAEISRQSTTLPARFGTVFLSEDSLRQHVKERQKALREAFERVADADEWGIKLFEIAKPKRAEAIQAASGSDYLKKKAEMLQPRSGQEARRGGTRICRRVDQAGGGGRSWRESQRGTARTVVARIISDSSKRPQEAGGCVEEIREPLARQPSHRLQRPLASVLVCGGTCRLSPIP